MTRLFRPFFVALGIATLAPASAQAGLNLGDSAPRIQVKEFLKGTPINSLEPGKTYVVEFWATWCAPCRESIPHLSELQKRYPSVTFVGVSVLEHDQRDVRTFVAQAGDKMGYRVAMDLVPAGGDGSKGRMFSSWMTPAGESGVPTAFIVNGQGKIAWIGHPGELEEPLARVVKGTWDVKKAAAIRKREAAWVPILQEMQSRLQTASTPAARLKVVDAALAKDPTLPPQVRFVKLQLMQASGAPGMTAFAAKLLSSVKDEPEALSAIASVLVSPGLPKAPSPDATRLALSAAQQADKLTKGKSVSVADTLARAYYVAGNRAMAVTTQERAVKLAVGTPAEKEPSLNQRLQQYRKAAGH